MLQPKLTSDQVLMMLELCLDAEERCDERIAAAREQNDYTTAAYEVQLKEQYEQRHENVSRSRQSVYSTAFPKNMAMELAFARAGGTLIVGTDPTGGGGLVPGYSNQRALELLVEAGFTPLEAIRIGTLNGATYLGRADKVGSVAVGKQADLVVIDGNPAASIGDIRKVQLVFKRGIGYDPARIRDALKGKVGLY